MLFLGVDGGGTKTAFVLIDQTGKVLSQHETKTCYHIEIGVDGARNLLRKGVEETLHRAGAAVSDITYAFFGLPAYGEDSKLLSTIDNMPSSFMPREKYQCGNDMVSGWAAAFNCGDGINIVSGTGSIAYGVRGTHSARCGGWGELFGDEGSAYWVGSHGLEVFSKMSDGRMQKGPLYEAMKTSLDVKEDLDVSALVHYEWAGERSKIAKVSTIVSDAANQGDAEARRIFNQAGKELALIVEATRNALGYGPNEQIDVSYSGGIFSAKELILHPFKEALMNYSSDYFIQEPTCSPVVGAARYACKLSGQWNESLDSKLVLSVVGAQAQ